VTFDNLDKWFEDIRNYSSEDVKILLVGNKTDLDDSRKVSYLEAFNKAKDHDTNYIEVSAKTGNNVGSVFEELTKIMVHQEEEMDRKRKKNKGKIEKSHQSVKQSIKIENDLMNKRTKTGKCCF
jgi:GTPase SAR1 family protein